MAVPLELPPQVLYTMNMMNMMNMMNLTPTNLRTITTEVELKDLLEAAFGRNELDISNWVIDVEFNLHDLLKQYGQPEIEKQSRDEAGSIKSIESFN